MSTSRIQGFQQYCYLFVNRVLEQSKNNVEERIALKKLKEAKPYREYVNNGIQLNVNYFRIHQMQRDQNYIANGIYRKSSRFDIDDPTNSKWFKEMAFQRKYFSNLKRNNIPIKPFYAQNYYPKLQKIVV